MTIKIVKIRTYDGDDVAYIGRGSPLENLWSSKPSKFKYVTQVENSEIAVDLYREYMYNAIKIKDRRIVNELKIMLAYYEQHGTLALGCFCKDETDHNDLFICENEEIIFCHGDVIREVLYKMYRLKRKFKQE